MRTLLVSIGLVAFGSGCAAPAQEEPTGDSSNAISEASAYERVVAAGRFKSGHLACGRTLELEGSHATEGTYTLDVLPCEGEDDVSESHTTGRFEVRGGWFGGALTNPTLHLVPVLPDGIDDDTNLSYVYRPWKMSVVELGESVRLTDARGTLVPEGLLD